VDLILCTFFTGLFNRHITYATIRVYLAGVPYQNSILGFTTQPHELNTLHWLFRGICRSRVQCHIALKELWQLRYFRKILLLTTALWCWCTLRLVKLILSMQEFIWEYDHWTILLQICVNSYLMWNTDNDVRYWCEITYIWHPHWFTFHTPPLFACLEKFRFWGVRSWG